MVGDLLNAIFTSVCYIVFCFLFVETFETKRKCGKGYPFVIGTVAIAIMFLCIRILYPYLLIKQVSILIIATVSMCSLFKQKFWKIGLLVILFHGMCIVIDYLVYLLLSIVAPKSFQVQVTVPMLQLLMSVLSQMIMFLGIVIIKRVFGKERTLNLNVKEWNQFLVFMIFSVACVTGLFVEFGIVQNEEQGYTLLGIAIGLLGMNLLMFSLIRGISKREKQIQEDQLFRERVKNETDMYRTISENYNKQRKREHEYLNHMTCITVLCHDKKYEELADYLSEVNDVNLEQVDVYDANHAIVNAILNVKFREAGKKGIVFVVKLNDLSQLFLSDEDIVIILSNLLNNAFEACDKCEDKVVKLKFVQEEKQVILSVINTYTVEPQKKETTFLSSKEDDGEHGIGIENIKETIKKYGGSYRINYEKGEFMFSIIFPC